jgi:predicted dehydrogenase
MVGFNRRFAPLAVQCRDFFQNRQEPLSLLYRINAGRLPADSWVLDPVTGGGRIIGEVCHFIDLCAFMTGALPERVFAEEVKSADQRLGDREAVSICIRFADHSVATIQYLSNGDTSVAKEYLELSTGGRSAILENFRTLSLHRDNRRRRTRLLNQAKGHAQEVAAFIDAVRTGGPMPIEFPVLAAVTRATFMIHESLGSGMPVDVTPSAGGSV